MQNYSKGKRFQELIFSSLLHGVEQIAPEIRSAESKQVFKAHLEQHLWLVAESNLDTD